jgi:DNA-binding FadR family transcriptional regulator
VPFQVVESLRLYRQIAGQISSLIDRGEFPVGSRLPPERELAKALGVSRTSVREAILALEIEGRVEVRVGTGIFVAAPAEPHDQEGGPGPFDLIEARKLIEGETVARAARTADAELVRRLRETIAEMRAADDDAEARDGADRAFHQLIADASGNSALALTVSTLWEQRKGGLWRGIEGRFHTLTLRAASLEDHEAIVDCLEKHDARGARAAMRRHLERVAHEFQRRWEKPGAATGRPSAGPAARRARLPGSPAGSGGAAPAAPASPPDTTNPISVKA